MTEFLIKKLPYNLSSHAGLAFIDKYLKSIKLNSVLDRPFPVRSGVANSDILKSYLGLLCLGKNDFDAIEAFRGDDFFIRALGLKAVPSSPTLRQRLDAHSSSWFNLVSHLNQKLLSSRINGKNIDFGILDSGYMPADLDTFSMDNSDSKKELVGRTYAGVDGYCPLAVYMGSLGYCLELALRAGEQHSASETQYDFERVLPMAASLTQAPLLVRADSGFCSLKLMQEITAQAAKLEREIAFIIKWNPRRTPVEELARQKDQDPSTLWTSDRAGKRECVWQDALELVNVDTQANPVRRVFRLTERTIDKCGALLLFHSEFKSDMDLERLPSGKFDTNYLVCQLAAVAMNLLRLIGQHTLNTPNSPMRHAAKRRRIKTVMQELMFKAARMLRHAGRWVLGLGQNDSAFTVFEHHYGQLTDSCG